MGERQQEKIRILAGLMMMLFMGACTSWNVDVSRLQRWAWRPFKAIGKPFTIRGEGVQATG